MSHVVSTNCAHVCTWFSCVDFAVVGVRTCPMLCPPTVFMSVLSSLVLILPLFV